MAMTRSRDNYGNPYSSPKSDIGRTLQAAMDRAAERMPAGYKVDAVSGQRKPGDTHNHDHGLAIDTKIYDPSGKYLGNYQDPSSFRAYEAYAQETRQQLYKMAHDPNATAADRKMAQQAYSAQRYGGYFSEGSKKPRDQMHQDENAALGMGGGGWLTGATGNKAYSAVSKPITTARWGLDQAGQTVSNADLGRQTPGWNAYSSAPAASYEGVDAVGTPAKVTRAAGSSNAVHFNHQAAAANLPGLFGQAAAASTPAPMQAGFTPGPLGAYSPVGAYSVNGLSAAAPSLPSGTPRPPANVGTAPTAPQGYGGPMAAADASNRYSYGSPAVPSVSRSPLAPTAPMGASLGNFGGYQSPYGDLGNAAVGKLMGNSPNISAPYGVMNGTSHPVQSTAGSGSYPGYHGAAPSASSLGSATQNMNPGPSGFTTGGMFSAGPQPMGTEMGSFSAPRPSVSAAPTYHSVANPDYSSALSAYTAAQHALPADSLAPGTPGPGKPGETAVGGVAGIGPQTATLAHLQAVLAATPKYVQQRVAVPQAAAPLAHPVSGPSFAPGSAVYDSSGNITGAMGANGHAFTPSFNANTPVFNEQNKQVGVIGPGMGMQAQDNRGLLGRVMGMFGGPYVPSLTSTITNALPSVHSLFSPAAPMGTAMGGFGGSHGGMAGLGSISGISPGALGGLSGRNGTTSSLGNGGQRGNDSGQQHG